MIFRFYQSLETVGMPLRLRTHSDIVSLALHCRLVMRKPLFIIIFAMLAKLWRRANKQ